MQTTSEIGPKASEALAAQRLGSAIRTGAVHEAQQALRLLSQRVATTPDELQKQEQAYGDLFLRLWAPPEAFRAALKAFWHIH